VINTVVFDLGGVVFEGPFEKFAELERRWAWPTGSLRRLLGASSATNAWSLLERGHVSVAEFERQLTTEASAAGLDPRALSVPDLLGSLAGNVHPEALDTLATLRRAGLKLGALTNTVRPLLTNDRDRVDVVGYFDAVVDSSRDGVRKPEPAAYELILARLGSTAHQTVFLDDIGANLKPARVMGMHTIKVDEPRRAFVELLGLLGLS